MWPRLALLALCALLASQLAAAGDPTAKGGGYQIEQYSIDGGSGDSSAGAYRISGSIGQADADPLGPASGGSYSLSGGVWAAIPPPSPPTDPLFASGFE